VAPSRSWVRLPVGANFRLEVKKPLAGPVCQSTGGSSPFPACGNGNPGYGDPAYGLQRPGLWTGLGNGPHGDLFPVSGRGQGSRIFLVGELKSFFLDENRGGGLSPTGRVFLLAKTVLCVNSIWRLYVKLSRSALVNGAVFLCILSTRLIYFEATYKLPPSCPDRCCYCHPWSQV
jgi:hypothetical protein